MSKRNSVTDPMTSILTVRIGRGAMAQLMILAERESVKTLTPISIKDLIRRALQKSYPEVSFDAHYE